MISLVQFVVMPEGNICGGRCGLIQAAFWNLILAVRKAVISGPSAPLRPPAAVGMTGGEAETRN